MLEAIKGALLNNALTLAAGAMAGAFLWATVIPLLIRKALMPLAVKYLPNFLDEWTDCIQKAKKDVGKATREMLINTLQASIDELKEDDGVN